MQRSFVKFLLAGIGVTARKVPFEIKKTATILDYLRSV